MVAILRNFQSLSRSASPLPSSSIIAPDQQPRHTSSYSPSPESSSQAPLKTQSSGIVNAAKRSVSSTGLSRKKEGSSGSVTSHDSTLPNTNSEPGRSRAANGGNDTSVKKGPTPERQSSVPPRNFRSFLHPSSRSTSPANGASTPPPSSSSVSVTGPAGSSLVSRVTLKLSELVNHAFPIEKGVSWNGRCATKPGVVKTLGQVILTELKRAEADDYLLRSLIRSAISRNLTLFMGRLESMPTATEIFVPKSIKELNLQPAGQRFNLENVKSAYELRAALERVCQPNAEYKSLPSFVADSLRPWSIKLDNFIARLMNPLVHAIKVGAADTVSAAKSPLSRVPSAGRVPEPTMTSISTPVAAQPVYLRELHNQLEAALQLLKSSNCDQEVDKWIVNIGSHLVWKAMLNYASRPCPPPGSKPSAVPGHLSRSNTPSRGKALPLLRNNKRGHSPPPGGIPDDPHERLVSEISTFRAVITTFTSTVLTSPAPPNEEALRAAGNINELCEVFDLLPEIPSDEEDDSEPDLAHEAMHEALLALASFELSIRALKWPDELTAAFIYDDDESSSSDDDDPARKPSAVFQLTGPASPATRVAAEKAKQGQKPNRLIPLRMPNPDLDRALDTLPPLITFHMLASRIEDFRLPHEIWGLVGGWQQYDTQLNSFSAGDNFKEEVGWEMVAELDRARAHRQSHSEDTWAALLRCAVKCEVGA